MSNDEKNFEQSLEELKDQFKLTSMDLEKRLMILEKEFKDFEKYKDNYVKINEVVESVKNLDEFIKKVKDLEDTELLNRLELVNLSDEVSEIDAKISILEKKISLITDALESIKKLKIKVKSSENDQKLVNIDIREIQNLNEKIIKIGKELENLKNEIASKKNLENLKKIEKEINEKIFKVEKESSEVLKLVRGEISKVIDNIDRINKEIDKFDEFAKKTQGKIEIIDKVKEEMSFYNQVYKKYRELEEIVERLEKEFRAERERRFEEEEDLWNSIDNFKKEFSNISSFLKNIDNKIENLKKIKSNGKIITVTGKDKRMLEELSKSLQNLEKKVLNIEDEVKKIVNEKQNFLKKDQINDLLQNMENLKKDVLNTKTKVNELFGWKDSIQIKMGQVDKTFDDIYNKISELKADLNTLPNKIEEEKIKNVREKLSLIEKDVDILKNNLEKRVNEITEKIATTHIANIVAKINKVVDELKSKEEKFEGKITKDYQELSAKFTKEMNYVKEELDKINKSLKDFENARDEIMDDVNVIISKELTDVFKNEKVIENFEKFLSDKLEDLETEFKEKFSILLSKIEDDVESKIEALEAAVFGAKIEENEEMMTLKDIIELMKLLQQENLILKRELKKLKDAYFQLVRIRNEAPIIID